MLLRQVFILILLILPGAIFAQRPSRKSIWIDSMLQSMNQETKIGQLFMITVSRKNIDAVESEIKNHEIGGVVFTEGGPIWEAHQTHNFQGLAAVPLLIGLDTRWKQGVNIDSAVNFPGPLLLGAIQDETMIYSMARETGRKMNELGIHINFDIPTELLRNPSDLEQKNRSFGSNSSQVTRKALAYMNGLRDEGILSCARYFTLKGLRITGVQNRLPVIQAGIDSLTVQPFQKLIENNVAGILPSPVDIPLFYEKKSDVKKNKFSTGAISSLFTGNWLKRNMAFHGLAFVDIEQAKRAGRYRSGEAETLALQAGNDIFITSDGIGPAIRKIKKLLRREKKYIPILDSAVKRILSIKYDAGLWEKKHSRTDNLIRRIASSETQLIKQKLYEASVTIVRDNQQLLPVRELDNKRIALMTTNANANSDLFHRYLSKYASVAKFSLDGKSDLQDLSGFDVIIAGIFPEDSLDKLLPSLKNLTVNHTIIACDFGHKTFLKHADEFPGVMTAYASDPEILRTVPQIIFGALPAKGILPYSVSSSLPEGAGIKTDAIKRFTYTIPEDAGMDSRTLDRISTIANEAIGTNATPGCYVLVAKDGKVIYEKAFGSLTYDKKIPVTDGTIYDLASLTKVSATLQTVMFMYEKGLIDINKKASYYLPELRNSNKKDFTIKDILTHQAGLWPFLPFWAHTMKDSKYLPEFYSSEKNEKYPFTVADHLYASATMKDSLWSWIVKAKIREKPDRTPFDYRYSDMGFYILQHLAEKLLNQPIEDFLEQNLYGPLGSETTGYLPLERFSFDRIAPTEDDKLFRKSLLIGMVHDQGAAMHGGIAGHAGLFSSANDLAKLGQMLLQDGYYGGTRFYRPETVKLFTQRTFDNSRRGLGWDKPTQSDPNGPTSLYASPKTFGHTGFTGTCLWVDPEFNLVYVFLSNRVHPDMTNNKLINANIRSRIQDVIYESIFKHCQLIGQAIK